MSWPTWPRATEFPQRPVHSIADDTPIEAEAARKLFRLSGTNVEVASAADIPQRLEAVYQAIYLLFSEGYHGSQSESTVREELCLEAIRQPEHFC